MYIVPKVSIIIPTYTNHTDFKLCLESIIKYTDLTISEVIVIANGAPTETQSYLQEKINSVQNLKLWWFPESLGYTKAVNIGIEKSLGEFVLFFNDDCQILESKHNEWIERLLKPFDNRQIQATGIHEQYSSITNNIFLIGHTLMIRKDFLNHYGYLDETFNPGYGEDTDICEKILNKGFLFKCIANNSNIVDDRQGGDFPLFHNGGKTFNSTPEISDTYKFVIERNKSYLQEKHDFHKNLKEENEFVYEEIFIHNIYRALAKEIQDSVVIDIGANTGLFSIFCKELKAKKIYAFEPSHETYNKLVENTEKFDNILTYNLAVTEKSDAEVYMMDDSVCSDIWQKKNDNVLPTKTITLKDIMSMMSINNKLVLKIDCEGSEFDIIYSTPDELLKRFSYIYIEVHNKLNPNYIDKHEDLLNRISNLGFNLTQGPVMGVTYPDGTFVSSPVTTWKCENKNNEITVIVPTYKRPEQLKLALNSILRQTYRKIKVFVIADGKDEIVENIVSEYNQNSKDIRFHYFDVEHEGNCGSKPRIHGIEQLSDYGFVCFLDDDNEIFPDYVEKMINSCLKHNQKISICQILLNNDHIENDIIPKTDSIKFGEIDSLNFMVANSVAKKFKDKWLNVGEKITHDYDFIKECTRYNDYSFLPEVLGIHKKSMVEEIVEEEAEIIEEITDAEIIEDEEKISSNEDLTKEKVIASVSTRGRYFTTLPLCLMGIASQTRVPDELIIFDDEDADKKIDLRTNEIYVNIFNLLDKKKISWRVIFGKGIGQVVNHQAVFDMVDENDLIWRLDDDNIPEANVLETLLKYMKPNVGAVGGLILDSKNNCNPNPNASNKIKHISRGLNEQWFYPKKIFDNKNVDHLYSSFLYRKQASPNGYCKELSRVGHREETIFTYEMKLNGYDVLFTPKCITWHFHNQTGGIRDNTKEEMWIHDEKIFNKKLKNWENNISESFPIVLANGIGDHYMLKSILPEIYKKHKNIVIYCIHQEVFNDIEKLLKKGININIQLVEKAIKKFGNIEYWNIYQFMDRMGWKEHMVEAFKKMYLR